MNTDLECTATFTDLKKLTVTRAGNGNGTVTSIPSGIDCGLYCSYLYYPEDDVKLSPTADAHSKFTGWTGDPNCPNLILDRDRFCTAHFNPLRYSLFVIVDGSGSGSVISDPEGINCSLGCEADFNASTTVTLTATADTGSVFVGWAGVCSGSNPVCDVSMTGSLATTAKFAAVIPQYLLTVSKEGNGDGTVTSFPLGISCGADCSESYPSGTQVMLSATAETGSVFTGWGGACSGTDNCIVTLGQAREVTASFATIIPAQYSLTVNKDGMGAGNVISVPDGIACGDDCGQSYPDGTQVTLTPNPDAGSIFAGWSGDADCADGLVTMNDDRSCTASFDLIRHRLLVILPGTGSGTVTSDPSGINCGTDCEEDYAQGSDVTLTAIAAQGSIFNGWAGACSGKSATCQVQINELIGVTANFTALVPGAVNSLYVTATGGGNVTSSPAGITCGAQCDADFDSATVVTLTPTPNSGLTFNGWRGACTGTSTCQVPMTNDQAVMAAFGNTYPSEMLLLQQDQLAGTGGYAAPRLVVLGPDLTVAAGSNLTVEAGERIQFLPGFKVENGARFKARINQTLKP